MRVLYRIAGSGATAGFASFCFATSDRDSQGDAAADRADKFEEDAATEGRDFCKIAEYLGEEVGAATAACFNMQPNCVSSPA